MAIAKETFKKALKDELSATGKDKFVSSVDYLADAMEENEALAHTHPWQTIRHKYRSVTDKKSIWESLIDMLMHQPIRKEFEWEEFLDFMFTAEKVLKNLEKGQKESTVRDLVKASLTESCGCKPACKVKAESTAEDLNDLVNESRRAVMGINSCVEYVQNELLGRLLLDPEVANSQKLREVITHISTEMGNIKAWTDKLGKRSKSYAGFRF